MYMTSKAVHCQAQNFCYKSTKQCPDSKQEGQLYSFNYLLFFLRTCLLIRTVMWLELLCFTSKKDERDLAL